MKICLLILLVLTSSSNGFYINSSNIFANTRNLSCMVAANLSVSSNMISGSLWSTIQSLTSAWSLFGSVTSTISSIANSTNVWNTAGSVSAPNIFDFCVILVVNANSSTGTPLISTAAAGYFGIDVLKEYVTRQCSSATFNTSFTPIGYGTCNPLPAQQFVSSLCICSTNNCNVDYSTCVASVQANLSPAPPPELPVLIPTVNSPISCQTNIQGPTYDNYATGYSLLQMANALYNITGFLGYQSSTTAACVYLYNVDTGDFFSFPTIYEAYSVLSTAALYLKDANLSPNYAESSTSVAIQHQSAYVFNTTSFTNLQFYSQVICICITNNCNNDLATCAIGLNMSQITTPSTTTVATTAATTTAPPSSSSCFSGVTHVRREDGSKIMMRDVRVGDRILVAESTYSPVLAFLLRREDGPMIDYLQIFTEDSVLEITPTHLILMRRQNDFNPPNYLQAAKLKPGDSVFISDHHSTGKIKEVKVTHIHGPIKSSDAYAPLTMEGTLIVNDMLVSCYAEYEYQSFIHFFMFPIRFWYSIIHYSHQFQNLHPYVEFWLKAGQFVQSLSGSVF